MAGVNVAVVECDVEMPAHGAGASRAGCLAAIKILHQWKKVANGRAIRIVPHIR
jgi:hypothetical protein